MIINPMLICTSSLEASAPFTHAEYDQKWPTQCLIGPQTGKWPYIAFLLHVSCSHNVYIVCNTFFWVQDPAYASNWGLYKVGGGQWATLQTPFQKLV